MRFFSRIKSMLASEYDGRLLENIIQTIATYDQSILIPLGIKKSEFSSVEIKTEYYYQDNESSRSADLYIRTQKKEIIVEIKVEDGKKFSDERAAIKNPHNAGQISDYKQWLARGEGESGRKRYFVLLTKYPVSNEFKRELDKVENASSLTLDDFAGILNKCQGKNQSPLLSMLMEYMEDEGLIMFDLDKEDISAFTSFMVLSFLPHQSGHGKQATISNIKNGPEVFSRLVSNWQSTTTHFSERFSLARTPTVRYWPYQESRSASERLENPVLHRRKVRNEKKLGAWTIFSDITLDGDNVEFGVEYSIARGSKDVSETGAPVTVMLYAAVRQNRGGTGSKLDPQYVTKILKKGLEDSALNNSYKLCDELADLCRKAISKSFSACGAEENTPLKDLYAKLENPND